MPECWTARYASGRQFLAMHSSGGCHYHNEVPTTWHLSEVTVRSPSKDYVDIKNNAAISIAPLLCVRFSEAKANVSADQGRPRKKRLPLTSANAQSREKKRSPSRSGQARHSIQGNINLSRRSVTS